MKNKQVFFVWGISIIVMVFILLTATQSAGASSNSTLIPAEPQEAYEPTAMLTESDLPGFRQVDCSVMVGYFSLAKRYTSGLAGPQAEIANIACFTVKNPFRYETIISFLEYPLSENDESTFDLLTVDPLPILLSLSETARDSGKMEEALSLPDSGDVGEKSMGFTFAIGQEPIAQEVDFLLARRGEILQSTWVVYPPGETPTYDVHQLGILVDQRVQEYFIGTTFRSAGEYVPDLTTHIPTPLDISTRPTVISANLLLAALMMLPFAAAAELFTRLTAEKGIPLLKKVRLPGWFSIRGQQKPPVSHKGKRTVAGNILRVGAIMLFYGVAFSLLDRTWRPLTITGAVLFLNMTLAYGLVGIADDIVQWRALRKWGTPAKLSLRPTNVLLAAGSTLASRLLTLVPGMMFGTPEALIVDEEQLDNRKRSRLLNISAATLLTIGFGLWAVTTVTELIQRGSLSVLAGNVIGGLEAFLLVIFAVALENTFVQMLGFPGSFGEALRKKNRWLWLLGMIGIAFVFYHTLINPRGDLAEAIQESNVLLLLGVSGVFVIATFLWWLSVLIKDRRAKAVARSVPESYRKPARKTAPSRKIPAWAWLVVNVVGLMVIGTLLLIPKQSPSTGNIPAAPTATVTLETGPVTPDIDLINQAQPSFSAPAIEGKLCYIPSVSIDTNLYDAIAWNGVQSAAAQFGTQAEFMTPDLLDNDGYRAAIDLAIQDDCALILGFLYLNVDIFTTAAAENPDQNFWAWGPFSSIAWENDLPNLWRVDWILDQGPYLAGYLAAAFSHNGVIGTFGGMDDPSIRSMMDCFARGSDEYNLVHNTSVTTLGWDVHTQQGWFAGDWGDPTKSLSE